MIYGWDVPRFFVRDARSQPRLITELLIGQPDI